MAVIIKFLICFRLSGVAILRPLDKGLAIFSAEEVFSNLYKELLNQWNEKQGQGMASLFAEDGSMVGFAGSQVNTN